MESAPVWFYFFPPLGIFIGVMLIVFRRPLQESVVAFEKKLGLPRWMRMDFMSEDGGATLLVGVGFIVIALGQAVLLFTHL